VAAAAPRPPEGAPRRRFSPPRGRGFAHAPRPVAPEPPPRTRRFERTAAPPAPAPEPPRSIRHGAVRSCRIALSERSGRTLFYARPPEGGAWLAASPPFHVEEGETVGDSPAARHALDALLGQLRADGWEIAGQTGRAPWQLELTHARRRGAPAETP
jgi:hypothetical protein